jgi:hypothetical protein
VIVRELDGRWIVIEQAEHARHAGAIAEAWDRGGLGPLPASLITAARLHDIGWAEWDREPALDPMTGGPANFTSVRDDRHSGFYARGIRSVAREEAYAGYLVSLHASGIYSGRYGWRGLEPIAWDSIGEAGRRFLADQRSYRTELLEEAMREHPDLVEFDAAWSCYMLLQTVDYLSLLCCLGLEAKGCGPVPLGQTWGQIAIRRTSPWGVALKPFPFQGEVLELEVASRSLPLRRYAGEVEMRSALAAAPVEMRPTRYERLPQGA